MMSPSHSAGGPADGGMDALFERGTIAGLRDGKAPEWNSKLNVEAGYGFSVFGGEFTGTLYLDFGASEGQRAHHLG